MGFFGFAYVRFSDSSSSAVYSINIPLFLKTAADGSCKEKKKRRRRVITQSHLPTILYPYFLENCQSPLMEEEECFELFEGSGLK